MEIQPSDYDILSKLEFDYFRETFINSYKGSAIPHKIAVGLVDYDQSFLKPDVLLFSQQSEYDNFRFASALILEADIKRLEDLNIYVTNNPDTTLLSVIFGLAKNSKGETGHVLIITASELVGDMFILSKGERVAKGERVSFDKGGQRVSIEVNS